MRCLNESQPKLVGLGFVLGPHFIKSCLWLPWLKVKWLSRMHWPPYVTNISAKIENHLHKHLDEIRDNDDGADASTAFVFASLPGWISLVEKKQTHCKHCKPPKTTIPHDHKFLQNVKSDTGKPFGLVHGHLHLLQ